MKLHHLGNEYQVLSGRGIVTPRPDMIKDYQEATGQDIQSVFTLYDGTPEQLEFCTYCKHTEWNTPIYLLETN